MAGAPDDFDVYSGDDGLTLPLLAVGAVGVVGVATHWSAGLHAEMIAAHGKNDVEGAREINARLVPSFAVEVGRHLGANRARPRRRWPRWASRRARCACHCRRSTTPSGPRSPACSTASEPARG